MAGVHHFVSLLRCVGLWILSILVFFQPTMVVGARDPRIPNHPHNDPVFVLPVIFIPADATLSRADIQNAKQGLQSHLKIAQKFYQSQLGTSFSTRDAEVYRARKNDRAYSQLSGVDSAHTLVAEMFDWKRENRDNSSTVYLIIYVRPASAPYQPGTVWFGDGRTFNGPPNSGGGYVKMEYTSLAKDWPFPFQSTLVHELGHAFGLTHVACYGYDDATHDSIMSLNTRHHSTGYRLSSDPGGFSSEDYYVLSLNTRVLPEFSYDDKVHNPKQKKLNISPCLLGAMKPSIGPIERVPDVGYELFYGNQLVSGPAATYYLFEQAQSHCDWYDKKTADAAIECRYNGIVFQRDPPLAE